MILVGLGGIAQSEAARAQNSPEISEFDNAGTLVVFDEA